MLLRLQISAHNLIKELKWKADPSLIGQVDKQNMTVHRWFKNKSCPGEYIYSRLGKIASEVNTLLGSETSSPTITSSSGLQATILANLTEKEVVEKIGPLCTNDQKKSGILASVSMAQFILESGYGKTDLAQNANNCFGMKKTLSGNTWSGSTWDGVSVYTKTTKECYDGSNFVDVKADFRKYPCVEKSIADHSAYLLGAKNGDEYRYEGLKGCTDYRKSIQIIKDGGYATDPGYVDKICGIIERWELTKYDMNLNEKHTETISVSTPFQVSVIIDDLNYRSEPSMKGTILGVTKKGIFTIVEVSNNWGKLKSGAGWIYLGNPEYCKILESMGSKEFMVRVNTSKLRIRKGPGTDYDWTGEYTGIGTFTIVEEFNGWGKLKSGAGWISLEYTVRV